MTDNGQSPVDMNLVLSMAGEVQPGPDGTQWVAIHIGSPILSCAFAFPHKASEQMIDAISGEIRKAAKTARLKGSGIILPEPSDRKQDGRERLR